MSTPPTQPVNKYVMHRRVENVEKLSANNDTAIRALTARFDRQPPQGERGGTGERGEAGRAGDAGRDGLNGAPGRDAVGIQGPQGQPGKDLSAEVAQTERAVARLEQNLAGLSAQLATLKQQSADMQLVVNAIYDQNVQGQQYIAYLRAKREAAIAARSKS
jgi:hypothetical protein